MSAIIGRFRVVAAVFRRFSGSGRWWMLPMLGVLLLLGMVLAGLSAVQYVAPFIYAVL